MIRKLKNYPSVIGNVHESCYRSYQILEKVKDMLKRGDSKKTILEVINEVEEEVEEQLNEPKERGYYCK